MPAVGTLSGTKFHYWEKLVNAVPATTETNNTAIMERVLVAGDLSKLSAADRLFYYSKVCESVGLNPLTKPFEYITLNNKLTLYARRDATDQLRRLHGISVVIKSRDNMEGVYIVTANAKDKTGREDESTGAVTIQGLKGDALANALMKAETKAKRRVTLSICGLGMLDETEIETIPGARAENGGHPEHVCTPEKREEYLPKVVAALKKGDAKALKDVVAEMNEGVQKGVWSFLSTKQKAEARELMQRTPPAQASVYVERMREALDLGIDERIKELHEEFNQDSSVALEVSALLTAGERERITESLDRLR